MGKAISMPSINFVPILVPFSRRKHVSRWKQNLFNAVEMVSDSSKTQYVLLIMWKAVNIHSGIIDKIDTPISFRFLNSHTQMAKVWLLLLLRHSLIFSCLPFHLKFWINSVFFLLFNIDIHQKTSCFKLWQMLHSCDSVHLLFIYFTGLNVQVYQHLTECVSDIVKS